MFLADDRALRRRGPARTGLTGLLLAVGLGGCGGADAILDGGADAALAVDLLALDQGMPPDLRPPADLVMLPDLLPLRFHFAAPVAVTVGPQPLHALLVDLDGDGKLDLVTANYGDDASKIKSTVGVLLGGGDGSFHARPQILVPQGANCSAAGDLDGDGALDLVVTSDDIGGNSGVSDVSVLLGKGGGSFAAAVSVSPGNGPASVSLGDFDGDGRPDVAVPLEIDDQLAVLLTEKGGVLGAPTLLPTAVNPFDSTVGDLNGDQRPDIVVANAASGTVAVYLGTGKGQFVTPAPQYDVGASASAVILGDWNGDGKLDVAAANAAEHSASVLLGNGDGTLQKELRLPAGQKSGSLCAGDFDGDHRLDLLIANHDDGSCTLFAGKGDGSFEPARTFAVDASPYWLACADLDGNGRTDVVIADDSAFSAFVMMSLAP